MSCLPGSEFEDSCHLEFGTVWKLILIKDIRSNSMQNTQDFKNMFVQKMENVTDDSITVCRLVFDRALSMAIGCDIYR